MSTALALPKGSLAMGKVMNQLSTTKARARELGRLAEQAQTPVGQVVSSQSGAVGAGVIQALAYSGYVSPERALLGQGILAAALILGGGAVERPDVVSAGCGALSVVTANLTAQLLTRQIPAAKPPAPAPAPTAAPV